MQVGGGRRFHDDNDRTEPVLSAEFFEFRPTYFPVAIGIDFVEDKDKLLAPWRRKRKYAAHLSSIERAIAIPIEKVEQAIKEFVPGRRGGVAIHEHVQSDTGRCFDAGEHENGTGHYWLGLTPQRGQA
jgi:hypothetical protein